MGVRVGAGLLPLTAPLRVMTEKAQAPRWPADDARQHARARRAAAYRIVPSVPFAVITRS
jgi:hypothetical protein